MKLSSHSCNEQEDMHVCGFIDGLWIYVTVSSAGFEINQSASLITGWALSGKLLYAFTGYWLTVSKQLGLIHIYVIIATNWWYHCIWNYQLVSAPKYTVRFPLTVPGVLSQHLCQWFEQEVFWLYCLNHVVAAMFTIW